VKLVFYGGGDEEDNLELDNALIKLSEKKSPRITYIPACSHDSERDFYEFVDQYSKFNITKFIYFPVDVHFDDVILSEAFKSDIIHLSGGNTYYFLSYLKENNLLDRLRKFVEKGGVLSGLSAGAILMTPNIVTAGFPEFDKDINYVKIKNTKSLGLVNFEFFPHYVNSKRYDTELLSHSRKTRKVVYACSDGSGIIVNGESIEFLGRAYCFYHGKKVFLTDKLVKKRLVA
jgi:dipeptidase E